MFKLSVIEELLAHVDKNKEELLALVQTLVAYPTPSPPARNTADAQQYIRTYCEKLGCNVDMWDVYPNDPNVVAILKGTYSESYRSLILNGHIDVAAVDESEEWKTPPFEATVNQGVIRGRGVADMKGGLAACLFAMKTLHAFNIQLPGDLIFQSVVGEEVGEAGTKSCCERGYTADLAIVSDTSHCEIQGQGGVITGWITVKSPVTFHDGTRRNLIHAGGGEFGASAIEKMMKLIQGLQELERHWAVTKSSPGFPPGMNTINPAFIEGGRHPAFIADECKLWITIHYYPHESYEEIVREVEEHLLHVAKADPWMREHPPSFSWGGTSMIEDKGEIFPAFQIDEQSDAVQLLKKIHYHLTGEEVKTSMSQTVTDGGWLAEAGIPTLLFGPGKLEDAHSVNEELEIAELVQYTKTLLTFIYEWCHLRKA
ncbi:acetylornithine deacetylase [Halalkalibacterium halodurans]|uniref:Acetylornithine deacetylase n=1 Tax=Halalkalibacterium halodurans TaxID=86665 RepID=A0A0M0KIY4_ALKHA|nr:acetylornithine deacetylase [Halalkalibacterium halodurans]MED3646280.1 acetylornithine deacetylase [Halalkalibacterium halodurans]MED4163162.1 acetylornithine deacetylase [Halalkalibacterium halodurans]TPE69451.1 acetylornithine deacetylase [Halalkalibacterium halodurans]